MKHFHFVSIVFLLLSLAGLRAQGRPIQFEDMFGMGRVADPHISPDGQWVAYSVTFYNIEKNRGNSDIYLVSTDGRLQRQLTTSPRADFSPRWAPDGRSLGFISTRDGLPQVYVIQIDGGEAQKITDIPTGVNDFSWAPNGQSLLVATDVHPNAASPQASAKMDEEREKNLAKGRIIDHLMYRYWNTWREGKYSHVLVVPVEGGKAVDITPGAYDTPPIDLGSRHDFVWSPDGRQVCFVRNPDKIVAASTNNDLWLTTPGSGKARQLTTNPANDAGPMFSPNGKYIAYMSMARAGFESDQKDLKILDVASGKIRNLTADLDRYVSDFVWAPNSRKLYFYTPWHGRHEVYEVSLRSGKIHRLLSGEFINQMDISPDGSFLVLARQAVNYPTELFRFDLRKKKLTQLTFTNKERVAELEMNPLEDYWFIGAKGDSVHLLMVKPPHFDKSKKYPLLELIHGGPQGEWGNDFHYRWNAEMFAAPGYVVIMINFHGSRGYGQKFCDAVSKDWGGAPFEDIIKGTRWALDNFDFVDRDRVGAAGASYGGFMINWIEGHNDDGLFKTLVSHDGVYDQRSMFGATEELWFPIWEFNGKPWDKGSLYEKWSPSNFVTHFNTPMLIVHGEHDYRVPYTQGLQLFTALQMRGVDSRLLFYPDEYHFVTKPQNARLWWKTVHGWLAKYLHP